MNPFVARNCREVWSGARLSGTAFSAPGEACVLQTPGKGATRALTRPCPRISYRRQASSRFRADAARVRYGLGFREEAVSNRKQTASAVRNGGETPGKKASRLPIAPRVFDSVAGAAAGWIAGPDDSRRQIFPAAAGPTAIGAHVPGRSSVVLPGASKGRVWGQALQPS